MEEDHQINACCIGPNPNRRDHLEIRKPKCWTCTDEIQQKLLPAEQKSELSLTALERFFFPSSSQVIADWKQQDFLFLDTSYRIKQQHFFPSRFQLVSFWMKSALFSFGVGTTHTLSELILLLLSLWICSLSAQQFFFHSHCSFLATRHIVFRLGKGRTSAKLELGQNVNQAHEDFERVLVGCCPRTMGSARLHCQSWWQR